MNRGLPVLEAARGLDSWRRPEGSRPLGTRMHLRVLSVIVFHGSEELHLNGSVSKFVQHNFLHRLDSKNKSKFDVELDV